MKISVVIINYNTFELTSNCIKSVLENTKDIDYEIILVDNASTERNPDDFLISFPNLRLIRSGFNGGFAYGNNLGLEIATGDLILLLNSDTFLFENSIARSADYYGKLHNAGVLGCKMTYQNGKVQFTARKFRSLSWELLDFFRVVPYLLPYSTRCRLMLGRYFRHDENIAADWLNGAFFMFDRNLLNILPGKKLDDRFFMYGEDQLWCFQISKAGYNNHFYAGTSIIHINSGSTKIENQLKLRKTMLRNELEIMKLRKGGSLYFYIFSLIFIFVESVRNLIKKIAYLISGKAIR
jgi:GT2 family glycosyltransferase